MAVIVTLTKVQTAADGRMFVQFSDGSLLEFTNLQAMKDAAAATDIDPSVVQLFLIQWWLKRNPDANNVQLLEGKTATWDLGATNAFTVK